MNNSWKLSRRTTLKAMGVSLGLPFLDVMGAQETKAQPPKRFAALVFPNGTYPGSWKSSGAGKDFKMENVLSPLMPMKEKMTTVHKLDHFGDHIPGIVSYLNGWKHDRNKDDMIKSKPTIDQFIAAKYAKETFLPSLHLGLEPPLQGMVANYPKSLGNSVSRTLAGYKIEPELSPQAAFDSLFGHHDPKAKKMINRTRRIVDGVWPQAKDLSRKVSKHDKQKLEQYFDSLRSVETKLEKSLNPPPKSWNPPTSPELKKYKNIAIPEKHEDYVRLMMDIMLLGMWTDTTRVSTLMYGVGISHFDYKFVKNGDKHHAASHHGGDPKRIDGYINIAKWIVEQSGYLMKRMNEIDEGSGTLLDNSLVLTGSNLSDGNVHDNNDVPVVLGGSAGGRIKTGRSITPSGKNKLSDLMLSILHIFDIPMKDLNKTKSKVLSELV